MANLVPLNYSHGLNFKGVPNVTPKRGYKGEKKRNTKLLAGEYLPWCYILLIILFKANKI